MVLLCVVHADGAPRLAPAGAPESRFVLLPAAACEIIDTWTVGGLRGTGSHDVVVRDVFVPSDHAAGFADPLLLPEWRYRLPAFSRVIPGLGAMALGIARTAIDTFCEIAGAKTPHVPRRCCAIRTGRRCGCRRLSTQVRSARLFLVDSVDRLWRELLATGAVSVQARAVVRLAVSHAVTSAVQTVDLMYVGAGASAMYACAHWSAHSAMCMQSRCISVQVRG